MAVSTVAEYLAVLEKSKLLGTEQLAEARRLAGECGDAATLAKTLARESVLSRWQAAQVLAGRTAFFLGKYKLVDLLGRGGMGSVFLAEHTTMSRRVALKVVPRNVSEDKASLARFFDEARAIASLDHPNIVQAYSVDNECGRYFIVMEYVDGQDLERIVESEGPMDVGRAADYIRQAADALDHAHARKMVHCDIKPSNLLVNQQGVIKLLDLGLARLKDDEPTSSRPEQRALGTVDYLAPEQALESPDFDHRADIYALGCTFYFLLTGHPPFPEGTLAQRIVKHQTQEPRSIVEERPDTPAFLANLCKKMMAKRPDERVQTAAEVRQALAEWSPPAQPSRPTPQPLKKAHLSSEDLPGMDASVLSWLDTITTTPSASSSDVRTRQSASDVRVPGSGKGAKKGAADAAKEAKEEAREKTDAPRPATVSRWAAAAGAAVGKLLSTRRRKIVAAATSAVVVLAALAGTLFAVFGTNGKPVAHTPPDEKSPTAAEKTLEPLKGPSEETPAAQEKTTPAPEGEGERTEPPKPAKKTSRRPERGSKTPARKTDAEKPPELKIEPKPEEKTDAKPQPEPKMAEPATPAPARILNPLAELSPTTTLPAIGAPASQRSPLGKVRPNEDDAVELQLVGGNLAQKGRVFSLRQDSGQKRQWRVQASGEGESGTATVDVARLSLGKESLDFEWLADATKYRPDGLRNCGLVIKVGEESKFLALREPKPAEPLVLDLDYGPPRAVKSEKNACSLTYEGLPDPSLLRLRLTLDKTFPPHEFKSLDGKPRREGLLSNKEKEKKLDIHFKDPKLAPFALRIEFDAKLRELLVKGTPMYNSAAAKRGRGVNFAIFKPGDAARMRAALEKEKERRILAIDNLKQQPKPKRGADVDTAEKLGKQQIAAIEEQLSQFDALYEALRKTAVIQFRVVLPVDKEHEVELFSTGASQEKVADAGKRVGG